MIMVHNRQLYLILVHCVYSFSAVTIDSMEIENNAIPEKGSSIRFVCTTSSAITDGVEVYKTDTSTEPTIATQVTATCYDGGFCVPGQSADGRVVYTGDSLHMYITISYLNRTEDGKWWWCRYKTSDGIKFLELVVYSSPSGVNYNTVPSTDQDLADNAVTLTCKTTSCTYPAPTFSWFYKQNDGSRQLYPTSGSVSDQAGSCTDQEKIYMYTLSLPQYTQFPGDVNTPVTFQCGMDFPTLTGKLYTNETPTVTFADIPDGPPVIQGYTNTSIYNVIEDTRQRLSCSITGGNPKATLSWTCYSGEVLDKSSGRTVTKEVTWEASRGPSGMCRCQSSHPISGTLYTQLTVNILYLPSTPQFRMSGNIVSGVIKVMKESNPSIRCTATISNPLPKYTWRYPGKSQYVGSTLTLTTIQTSANGVYRCEAENQMDPTVGDTVTGSNSSSISLQVLYKPIVRSISDQVIEENTLLNVSCPVTPGLPAVTYYKWTRTRDSRGWTSNPLIISAVQKGDADTYTCTANNVMDLTGEPNINGIDSKQFLLDVQYKASIISFQVLGATGDTVTVDENDTVSFKCVVSSHPGATMTIQKDGRQQTTNDDTTKIIYPLMKASCLDAGVYTCTGSNKYNNNPALSGNKQLYVKCSPRPSESVELKTTVTATVHDNGTLSMTVTAYPSPSTFVWSRYTEQFDWEDISSGGSFIITSHGLQSNLTIIDIHESDFGQYKLEVDNGIGSAFSYVYNINAEDIPETPTQLRHIPETVTQSSVTVQWKSGFNGGPKQSFVIQYKKQSDIYWNVEQMEEPASDLTITGLSPGTMYEVRIYAHNAVGNSSTTVADTFKTADIPETPTQLRHIPETVTQSSVTVQWKSGFNGGPKQSFVIQYKKQSDIYWNVEQMEEPASDLTITGLSPGTMYEVRIYAHNAVGNSSTTVADTFKTADPQISSNTKANTTAELVGTFVGGVAFTVMVIAAIIIVRRQRKQGKCACIKASNTNDQHVEDASKDQHVYFNMSSTEQTTEDVDLKESGSDTDAATYETTMSSNPSEHLYTDLKASSQVPGTNKPHTNMEMYENLKLQTNR